MKTGCALCEQPIISSPIIDNEHTFCCPGCHAVYRILSVKGQLGQFQDTTIFKQAVSSGLISNPILLDLLREKQSKISTLTKQKIYLEIHDMWCPACADILRYVLLQEKGIYQCIIDYTTDMAVIEFTPFEINLDKIKKIIASFGYDASTLQQGEQKISRSLSLRFGIAAFCALNIMMLAYPIYAAYFHGDPQGYNPMLAWTSLALTMPTITYCAWPIWQRLWNSLKVGLFGMETLVAIGVITAFGLSLYELSTGTFQIYFDSLTIIIALVLLGKIIETKAKISSKASLFFLSKMMPKRGCKRFPDGTEAFVSIKNLAIGDIVVAKSGEKIVLDGVVVEGEGMCDESLMTGEAVPVLKKAGSTVLSGSFLQGGAIAYCVTNEMEQTVFHHILEATQQESSHKPLYNRAADHIVKWFVPLVVSIAAAAGMYHFFFARETVANSFVLMVSVLLISCPCAIGVAAPLAEARVISKLAQLGVIVRNRGVLAFLGRETCFVFDKTGTVTEGKFELLQGDENLNDKQLSFLKGLASKSNHPIATAIANKLLGHSHSFSVVSELTGLGLKSSYEGKTLLLGSQKLLSMHGIKNIPEPQLGDDISTYVYFAIGEDVVAVLFFGDRIKESAVELIKKLKTKILLLSGDNERCVSKIAKSIGFCTWFSGMNPLQKKEWIMNLRNQDEIICMIGDGINDAPALSAAHIGISVVSASDISIQVSDLLLTNEKLSIINDVRRIAVKGRRIIKQNLFWAFFYNIIGIGLAILGLLSPIFAAFAMTASSLMILVNTRRI